MVRWGRSSFRRLALLARSGRLVEAAKRALQMVECYAYGALVRQAGGAAQMRAWAADQPLLCAAARDSRSKSTSNLHQEP